MKKNNFKIIELKPEKNKNSVKRTVFIKDFIVHEIIGIHDHEKIKKQNIKSEENLSRIRSLERRLDRVNHIMELIRTIIPILVLLINLIILLKIFDLI